MPGSIKVEWLPGNNSHVHAGVRVSKTVVCCGGGTAVSALVVEDFVARETSIGWKVNVSGLPRTGATAGESATATFWSAPLVINVTFAESGNKKFWAPWEKSKNPQCCTASNFTDALLPSDGGFGWKDRQYLLGGLVVPASDYVIHEMATILYPERDVGVSFIPNPTNPPVRLHMCAAFYVFCIGL